MPGQDEGKAQGRSAWEGGFFPNLGLLGITRRASSPRRFLGQERALRLGSTRHKAAGDASGGNVVIDHHHAGLRARIAEGGKGRSMFRAAASFSMIKSSNRLLALAFDGIARAGRQGARRNDGYLAGLACLNGSGDPATGTKMISRLTR